MNADIFASLVVPYAKLGKQLFWMSSYVGNRSIVSKTVLKFIQTQKSTFIFRHNYGLVLLPASPSHFQPLVF